MVRLRDEAQGLRSEAAEVESKHESELRDKEEKLAEATTQVRVPYRAVPCCAVLCRAMLCCAVPCLLASNTRLCAEHATRPPCAGLLVVVETSSRILDGR